MTKIRLLPLVLIAVVALLAVKVLGLVMGVDPFPVGPQPAAASGAAEASHGEVAGEATPTADTSAVDRLTAPVDLAREFEKLKEEQAKGGHGEAAAAGHGEAAAAGHGEAAPAGHGEAAPADAGHGEAAPAVDAAHGEAAPAADAAHGEAAADSAHGEAAADAAHAGAAAADAGHGEAAPAADTAHAAPAADAHGAPAEGGHGDKPATGAYTERPKEYSPPIGSSETAILEGLAVRRDALDQREHDLDLRAKLLQAAEKRLEERLLQLQSIESQLGGTDPAAAPTKATAGAPAAAPAGGAAKGAAAAPADDQITALVSLYESMKPKAAAAVFDKLPAPTLIELASRMNPRKLSPIMAAMNPDIAGRVTSMLVGAQQAQKKVVVQVEQVAPEGLLMPAGPGTAPTAPAELPQIMPAEPAAP